MPTHAEEPRPAVVERVQVAQLAEVVTADIEHRGHDGDRLDVVHGGRTAERAVLSGKRRLQARLAAPAFEGVQERSLLATDVGACAGVHVHLDLVVLPHGAPPEVAFESAELSPMGRSFYAENRRVRNARLKDDLGVRLAYPSYREGLAAVLVAERRSIP